MHRSKFALDLYGIKNTSAEYWNLSTAALIEESVRRHEGVLAHRGPLVVRTGHHTGRAANDKFIVREPSSEKNIWWGKVNRSLDPSKFDGLFNRLLSYIEGRELFIQDCYVGADARFRLPIRIINETAWHSLFARTMFLKASPEELQNHQPEFTVIDMPRFHAVPEIDGTNSEVFVIINFLKKIVLIGGTSYAGEIKKSIFTIMNYLLPLRNVFPMHCSANVGPAGDVAIFFGLSGTGKTTLSADPRRKLIGDDEHGWSDHGVFNFEGGCYAKVIRLSKDAEAQIYDTTRRFGTVLENVMIDSKMRRVDLNDASLTENTRAAYPLTFIDNAVKDGLGGHPRNVIMLTADAFGVLPPIARLSAPQARYHFISGYTAKIAGTEKGLGKEPQATFSTCFGAPFMVHHPTVYAKMLNDRIAAHHVTCWLVNTGWTGGPFGVGTRMKISHTRAMIDAALSGKLDAVPTIEDPVFALHVPECIDGLPQEMLQPRNTWSDKAAYDDKARELAGRFHENFAQFAEQAAPEVRTAGPKLNR